MTIYPKLFFKQEIAVQPRTCFSIMPFKDEFDAVYAAIKAAYGHPDINFECVRGDEVQRPHIIEIILEKISGSEVIVADLSGQNPNVFYELGLAHCVKEPDEVLLLAQRVDDIPFDLRQYRHIIYEASATGLAKLQADIKKSLVAYLGKEYPFTLMDGKLHAFPKLQGEGKYLYECTLTGAYIGADMAKLEIGFVRYKYDKTTKVMERQHAVLGPRDRVFKLAYIPWDLHFVKIEGEPSTLTAVLQQRKTG